MTGTSTAAQQGHEVEHRGILEREDRVADSLGLRGGDRHAGRGHELCGDCRGVMNRSPAPLLTRT